VLAYCDTNVYCRPFDDQSQARIKAETEAFIAILEQVDQGKIVLTSSDVLVAEVGQIASRPKRQLVELYLAHCGQHIVVTPQIVQLADHLVKRTRLKPRDALHVAAACVGQVAILLTCDDRVARKRQTISQATRQLGFEVSILNPLDLLVKFGQQAAAR